MPTLLELLYPPKCAFCRTVMARRTDNGLCGPCAELLPGAPLRFAPDGVPCVAVLAYRDQAREAFLRYKFQGQRVLALPFGYLIAQAAAEEWPALRFDCVTWAPVSAKRKRERGYDQSEILARRAAKLLDKPVILTLKRRDTPPQSGLPDVQSRRDNVQGAYTASDAARDRRVLLIDDVSTSGATLRECIATLKKAGAQSIVCAVLAKTGLQEKTSPGTDFC